MRGGRGGTSGGKSGYRRLDKGLGGPLGRPEPFGRGWPVTGLNPGPLTGSLPDPKCPPPTASATDSARPQSVWPRLQPPPPTTAPTAPDLTKWPPLPSKTRLPEGAGVPRPPASATPASCSPLVGAHARFWHVFAPVNARACLFFTPATVSGSACTLRLLATKMGKKCIFPKVILHHLGCSNKCF